jgi:hypothetical protein
MVLQNLTRYPATSSIRYPAANPASQTGIRLLTPDTKKGPIIRPDMWCIPTDDRPRGHCLPRRHNRFKVRDVHTW